MTDIIKKVQAEAGKLMKTFAPPGWDLRLGIPVADVVSQLMFGPDVAKLGILGQTNRESRQITINSHLVEMYPDAEFWQQTILHEIAHAIVETTGRHGHDAVWQAQAESIGCVGANPGLSKIQSDIKRKKGWEDPV